MKKLLISLSIFITSLFFAVGIKAAPSNNPVFATIDLIEQLIADVTSVLQEQIDGLDTRVTDLENAPSPASTKQVKIVDSTGVNLGTLVDTAGDWIMVYNPELNLIVRVSQLDGSIGAKEGVFQYLSDDCTGDKHLIYGSGVSDFLLYELFDGSYGKADLNNRRIDIEAKSFSNNENCTPYVPSQTKTVNRIVNVDPSFDPISLPFDLLYE